jgi:hypothetical protein
MKTWLAVTLTRVQRKKLTQELMDKHCSFCAAALRGKEKFCHCVLNVRTVSPQGLRLTVEAFLIKVFFNFNIIM